MQDFFCENPRKMNYRELAQRADYFKAEEEGVHTMCDLMERLLAFYDNEGDGGVSANQRVVFLSDCYRAGVEFEHGVHSTEIRISAGGVGINGSL